MKRSRYGRSRYLCVQLKNKANEGIADDYVALDLEDILYLCTCTDDSFLAIEVKFKNGEGIAFRPEIGKIVYEAYKTYQEAKLV